MQQVISSEALAAFERWLNEEEKSEVTIQKYIRDVKRFAQYAGKQTLAKDVVKGYKEYLLSSGYAVSSINSMLASLNSFLHFAGREECRVKALRFQKPAYCETSSELTKAEYLRLLKAAQKKPRIYLLLQTICETGIRVSELPFFTVEAVRSGTVIVRAKAKSRKILLPTRLKKQLLQYAKSGGRQEGCIFCSRCGKPLNRSNIWAEMKALSTTANVAPEKVYPHNLRKLFARTFYSLDKDMAKLADLLGHSSINTTRIYIVSSGSEHRRMLEQMHLEQ